MEAMRQSGKIGIAKIAIRSKSSLAAIRVMEGCLAIETIFYPDEIRPISQVPNLPENLQVNDKELTMAKMLIEQLSTPFEPEKYTDDYREGLLHLIEQKVAGEEISLAPAKPETNVIDLMAALQASIEAVKPVATDPGPAAATPAKRTRKPAAKKRRPSPKPLRHQMPGPLRQPLRSSRSPSGALPPSRRRSRGRAELVCAGSYRAIPRRCTSSHWPFRRLSYMLCPMSHASGGTFAHPWIMGWRIVPPGVHSRN